jgi:mycobactin lysine-N-oxygenase
MAKSADAPPSKLQHPVEIAVIGGGPKAAAIAAKAWVLRNEKLADVHVTVFEPERVGANWAGKSGYTDGEQRLCTIVERDVGYPYNSMFEESVDAAMSSKFSWARFLHTRPSGYEKGYSTWVDAGRKPPRHRHFADYLKWVMDEASPQVQVVKERVVHLTADGKRWQIETVSRNGRATHSTRFDATVVTGPGPARRLPEEVATGATRPSNLLFNGQDFWQRLPEVSKFIKTVRTGKHTDESEIVIIGAGGTAAAILSWLVSNGAQDLPIQMVANQASLYTRVDSVFENRLFSDETRWQALSSNSRRAFFDRLNRGVVWETVMDNVSSASRFTMVEGRAQKIVISSSNSLKLVVELGDGEPVDFRPAMLIDCTGFDSWWFLEHISGFPLPDKNREKKVKERWQQKMSENLQFQGTPWNKYPPLHAPMHSGELGPGFASLMVLGAMADRILRPHRF